MKTVPVNKAVGMVLCHDLTEIIPGKSKGPAFKKGHIIQKEDIPRLLNMGKERLYVWDLSEGLIHEDAAAERIATAVTGKGIKFSPPKEGKIELIASNPGLLKINIQALYELNSFSEIMMATIHTNQYVNKNKFIAGTRIIPLVISEDYLKTLEQTCVKYFPIIEVKPLDPLSIGIVTTGSEVYKGRIKDGFGPVLRKKFGEFDCTVLEQVFVPDDKDMITNAIHNLIEKGANAIAVTGGMSVDPDDVTPIAIRETGADIICYGAPVLPGAMFMLAYLKDIPIMGLPGCVMYYKTTIFDLIFPRIQAGERLERNDIIAYSHGGLCLNCKECRYPVCAFGKSS